ncbi:hypothetical protein GUJ93_ZPchr0001g30993 [Zizania palustris]|uniref:Late embryogenesis abundant protein LEA-2 subgroup domain-containing protein n=1 Tax=Zizania palustris TaxID=103762 RepID=A0A8J5RLK4_ZIZPA|nr:hypothetical protein GUJ93_ZPchr0001g30993 [Zizania palustris]KAG8051569.1 hypothetical protein GUJ93_ZPchr0001g30993 [Zizania palustris]
MASLFSAFRPPHPPPLLLAWPRLTGSVRLGSSSGSRGPGCVWREEGMGDRAYAPASKPVPVVAARAANGVANGGGGGAARPPPMVPGRVPPPPMYRPKPMQAPPRRRRSRRGWCCACCLWLTLVVVGLVFLGAIAAGVFYVMYHPQLPSFAVTSLRLAALNVSDSDAVTSRIEYTVTARNPNDKIAFAYGDIAAGFSADGADVGDGTVPGFLHPAGNTTVIKGSASASATTVDPVQANNLRSKKSHSMSVEMDSKVGFQVGRFKSKRINVRVLCSGFTAALAKNTPSPPPIVVAAAPSPIRSLVKASSSPSATTTTTDAKCKLRVKIWIWTF